jgi:TonB family protein
VRAVYFFIFFLLPVSILAQTVFSGPINRNTRWFGQVYVNGDVTVSKGVTLFIEPGSRIVLSANTDKTKSGADPNRVEFVVLGTLAANGESGDGQILFALSTTAPQPGDWYGIILKNRNTASFLENCIIEYAYKGITCYGSSPVISGCEFRYNQYAGISCEIRSAAQIRNCNIINNAFAGIICELGAIPLIEKNVITENVNGVIIFDRSQPELGRYAAKAGESVGENQFFGNIETDLYNRSTYTIYAQNNIWNTNNATEIREKIKDKSVNPSYGEIIFEPVFGRRPPIFSRQFPPAETTRVETTIPADGPATNLAGSNGNPTATLGNPAGAAAESVTPQEVDTLPAEPVAGSSVVTPETLIVYREIFVEKPVEYTKPVINEPVLERQLDSGARHYINMARPVYPEIYKQTGYEGRVIMEVIVDRDGGIEDYKILRSNGEHFVRAAEDAIRKMRYRPETFQGQPVKFKIFESFIFKLGE